MGRLLGCEGVRDPRPCGWGGLLNEETQRNSNGMLLMWKS